ncbi:MAG: hypothetical protein ABJM06_13315 [Gilvibacter sp.]
MSSKIKKEIFLWSAAVCFVFGQNATMASTHFTCHSVISQLTPTSNEDQVFFEAEELYSVNFKDHSPRNASQATHDKVMTTWTNKISISSERISRNLRGYDHFHSTNEAALFNNKYCENSYITSTLIYSAHNSNTIDLNLNGLKLSLLDFNLRYINSLTTHSPHGAGNSFAGNGAEH